MEGWRLVKIVDVIEPLTTVAPRRRPDETFEYIDVSSVSRNTSSVHVTSTLLGRDAPSRARRLVHTGDVLFATIRPTLQRIAPVPDCLDGSVCSTGFFVLRPRAEVLGRFLFHYLFSRPFSDEMTSLQRGASYPAVSDSDVKAHVMLLPSLPEQERIVAILDEAFAAIGAVTASAEKSHVNARELFESELSRVFEQKGEGWAETTLGECLSVQPRNGWSPPAAHHSSSGVPVLTLSSVTGFRFRGDKVKYTSAPTNLERHYWVDNGDFLMTRSNTSKLVGHVAIATGITEPTIYPDLIMRMNPDESRLLTEFLYYQMQTPRLRDEIMGRAQGANPTMRKINKRSVQTLPVTLPSLKAQQAVIAELEALAKQTKSLESIYRRELAALTSLKQSILHKAFTGELTADFNATDVALSKGEV